MELILTGYEVNEPTWFYLSLLLIIAVFFRFHRVFSLRNLDLVLLLSLAPGLLFVRRAPDQASFGYVWLFVVSGILLARLIGDSAFTRRPRLAQNLNAAGLGFLCCSALMFQFTKIMTEEPEAATVETVRRADDLLHRQDSRTSLRTATIDSKESEEEEPRPHLGVSPTSTLFATSIVSWTGGVETLAARWMAFLAHLSVVLSLICVGRWHFGDINLGLAMATLYLLLPCTAFDVTKVNHLLPAALIVWAVTAYRRPIVAGSLLGLACGSMFFAGFLLPVWVAFYWKRGAARFSLAVLGVGAVLLLSLVLTSANSLSFTRQIIGSIDWSVLKFEANEVGIGFWTLYDPAYRIPVFATFTVLVAVLTIWPAPRNLEHLLTRSAAIVVATQFWYPHQGGIYVLWYLPLVLMVVFRPSLQHLPPQPSTTTASVPFATDRRGLFPPQSRLVSDKRTQSSP